MNTYSLDFMSYAEEVHTIGSRETFQDKSENRKKKQKIYRERKQNIC